MCTAEVIAPRVLLTAAHCVVGGNYDKTGWTFEVFVGADVHHPARGDRRVAVTQFHVHPLYGGASSPEDGRDGDIAVLLVAEDLGLPAMPFSQHTLPMSLSGTRARYVGYGGLTTVAKGKRHVADARIEEVSAAVVRMSSAVQNPCHGDSGGPLMADLAGSPTVLGVGHVSFGDEHGDCVAGADYTRTDIYLEFIRSYLP